MRAVPVHLSPCWLVFDRGDRCAAMNKSQGAPGQRIPAFWTLSDFSNFDRGKPYPDLADLFFISGHKKNTARSYLQMIQGFPMSSSPNERRSSWPLHGGKQGPRRASQSHVPCGWDRDELQILTAWHAARNAVRLHRRLWEVSSVCMTTDVL